MKKISFIFITIFLLTILNLSYSAPIEFSLNQAIKSSLPDKSYGYYKLKIPKIKTSFSPFLIIEARRNVEQDIFDNVFSDPNLYISLSDPNPSPSSNTWSSSRFGDEIISIDQKYVKSGAIFYISVYCQFKCNFILDAKLYNNYILQENKVYSINIIPDGVLKITFKSRKNYQQLKVSCVSFKMRPFQIFLSKKDPSSSNSLPSNPIFLNGYYFIIRKGDQNYFTDQQYEVLIENKEYNQVLLFFISYDNEDIELNELMPLFGSASKDSGNCYKFNIDKQHLKKDIIISTTLFNGNGYLRIGGWEKVKDMKVKLLDKSTYPIITDKSILLTQKDFEEFGKIGNEQNKKLHFCFIASEETSYTIKVYYKENAEKAQRLNYLLPGIGSDDMLPGKTVTKYALIYLQQNKDIKIELKIKKGNPKLYVYYTYEDNSYINKNSLIEMKKKSETIIGTRETYQKYIIRIDSTENKCILYPNQAGKECKIYAVVDCENDKDCLYELFFDHIGNIINMKPKVIYSNVITEKETDKYEIHITDDNIQNFAIILNQNTGSSKLKITKFISTDKGEINIDNSEKYNKNYMPNVIEIKSSNFIGGNIKGKFLIDVIGNSFSSYSLYYYTFDESTSSKLDHKTISMPLIKGNIIQDYIKDSHNIKVYSYDNSNIGNKKVDLFLYIQGSGYISYRLYVFKSLDDYYYEKEEIKGFLWQSNYLNYIHISKDDPKYIIGNLYIMVLAKSLNELYTSNLVYRKDNPIDYPFLLVITDEFTPLNLLEGVEFKLTLTEKKIYQSFYYNHRNNEDFLLSITITYSKIKISIKLEDKDFLYEKTISGNYFLKIESKDIYDYCPSLKSCDIEIKIEAINYYDLDFDVILLCKSSLNSIVYLTKGGLIEKRKITNNEKQYFVVEANPSQGINFRINVIFDYGRAVIFAKKAEKNIPIEQMSFPDEDKYEYSSNLNNKEELSIIDIPYEDIKNDLPCKILLTVKGIFDYLGRTQGEYSISISNIIDDIFINKNYRFFISKGEINYYRFSIKGEKKRLSISMTNKEVDAYMYLNYGTMNKNTTDFQWKSEGSYNEYIDISIEDPFFVSRKINSLEGEYFLAIRGFKDTYYNLFITDSDTKIMTITEQFPGTCMCEKEGEFCYFRYENIISPEIAEVSPQELIFYFEFTYGSAQIYAKLFENGNNGIILKQLPTQTNKDYKSLYSNQFLRINLTPGMPKYSLDSVLVLGARCNSKSMFDFNVRPIWKSGDILQKSNGLAYLSMDKDNIFFISASSDKPINLTLYSIINLPITYEAKAISGSAEVHSYIFNDKLTLNDNLMINKINGYKHLSQFAVDEKDTKSYFESISKENSFRQNLFFEIKAKIDCLFSIHLHYTQDFLFIPMSKEAQGKFKDGKFYAYIELLPEYEEVILTVDKMHPDSKFSIYTKTNILDSLNFKMLLSYSAPSDNNFDIYAKTSGFNPSLSIKIKNLPKELYQKGKKIITIFYIQANNEKTYNDNLNMIVYPNVEHYERISPIPNKYIYSSLNSKKSDITVFSFKQQEYNDNLLIIEISSCRGNLGYKLTNGLRKDNLVKNFIFEEKGKKKIIAKIQKNEEYFLTVYGLKEDEMLFNDYEFKTEDVDFLLYYYTIEEKEYNQIIFDSKLSYDLKGPGSIILNLPNLETIYAKNGKNKLDDLTVSVIITQNKNEYEYMGSICFLSKKYEYIQEKQLYNNYTINIDKNRNKIEIKNLDKNQNYYMNVLISNKRTGEIFALDPLQLKPNRILKDNNVIATLLIIGIIILIFVVFYFYRKYRITKSIVNYESNDIKNMGSIPKSITELKKIQEEKIKISKEKYNSLTEDPSQI